jgi:hypothetical protein
MQLRRCNYVHTHLHPRKYQIMTVDGVVCGYLLSRTRMTYFIPAATHRLPNPTSQRLANAFSSKVRKISEKESGSIFAAFFSDHRYLFSRTTEKKRTCSHILEPKPRDLA